MSYTPTRSTVRGRYAGVGESASPQARAEFDRWEAKVIREAKAQGIRAAASACRSLVNMQVDETSPYEMLEEMDKMAARFEEPR